MGPATHPIRGEVPDVSQAMANFDAISYLKGQAVLKQLSAYVGEDAFVAGLPDYFRDHAWGNTRLEDLTDAVGAASGEDLQRLAAGLARPRPAPTRCACRGEHADRCRARRRRGATAPPRHRLLRRRPATALRPRRRRGGPHTTAPGPRPVELPDCDLRLVNDHDLTFAAVRTDAASLELLLGRAGQLPDALSRALAVATAYDMLVKGELSAEETLTCVARRARDRDRGRRRRAVPAAGGHGRRELHPRRPDHRGSAAGSPTAPPCSPPASRSSPRVPSSPWRRNATTAEHFAQVDEAAADDLGARLAGGRQPRGRAGDYDERSSRGCSNATPTPTPRVNALAVRASRNLPEAKEEAWQALYVEQSVPGGVSHGRHDPVLLAARAARRTVAVHRALPRGDPQARRRRHASRSSA